jgi:competence protein ComEC
MSPAATIYFLDVGQGSSQVIHFEDGSLVILDCGRSGFPLRRLLEKLKFNRINALILSHLHNDHCGGAHAILDHYPTRIDQVFIPLDRHPEKLLANSLIHRLKTLTIDTTAENRPFGVGFLVRDDTLKGRLHLNNSFSRTVLSVLYPLSLQALVAQGQTDPNQGSGILMLECSNKRILFPGDAGKVAFKALKTNIAFGKRLACDLIATPHHGGKLEKDKSDNDGHANVYEWLYTEILDVKNAIFSVGSGNGFDHPRLGHMDAVRRSGSNVICTQMTSQCHSNHKSIGKSLLPILGPSACSREGTGCAGTVVVKMFEDRIEIDRFETHQQLVDNLRYSQTPLCRRPITPIRTTVESI